MFPAAGPSRPRARADYRPSYRPSDFAMTLFMTSLVPP